MTAATETSTPDQSRMVTVGDALPRVSFRRLGATGTVSWSQGPMAPVVFLPHLGGCRDCDRYLGRLGAAVEGLNEWATRPIVLVATADADTANASARAAATDYPPGIIMLADDGAGRAQLGVAEGRAAVVQADRWGAVYDVATVGPEAGHDAGLPTVAELVALAKFIDIQCPECGIPSREWLDASPFPLG